MFPLRDDVRWFYRVHEQILPALRKAGVPLKWTDLTVRHTGYSPNARVIESARAAEVHATRSWHQTLNTIKATQ